MQRTLNKFQVPEDEFERNEITDVCIKKLDEKTYKE